MRRTGPSRMFLLLFTHRRFSTLLTERTVKHQRPFPCFVPILLQWAAAAPLAGFAVQIDWVSVNLATITAATAAAITVTVAPTELLKWQAKHWQHVSAVWTSLPPPSFSQQALIRGLVKASVLLRLGPLSGPQVCKVPALHPRGQLGFIYSDSYLRGARCCSRHRYTKKL